MINLLKTIYNFQIFKNLRNYLKTKKDISQTTGQINPDTEEGKLIYSFIMNNQLQNILDIGTWNGLGSTKTVIDAIISKKETVNFISLEADKLAFKQAKKNLSKYRDYVNLIYGRIVDVSEMPDISTIDFEKFGFEKKNSEWFYQDIRRYNKTKNILNSLPTNFDFVIFDGGEFTTYSEFKKLWKNTKYVGLDDIYSYKQFKVLKFIKANPHCFNLIDTVDSFSIYEVVSTDDINELEEFEDKKIALALVADFKYLYQYFSNMYKRIRVEGQYDGEVILLTGKYTPTLFIKEIRRRNNVSVFRFPKIIFNQETEDSLKNLNTGNNPNRHLTKNFQWNKLHLFDSWIKDWDYIFYLDINMSIHDDIKPILKNLPLNGFHARSDSYPTYEWKLESQFDQTDIKYNKLSSSYDLEINNYFQTGVMYFDTKIIDNNTKKEIIDLVQTYPISITNEQGILNIYFIFMKNLYKELPSSIGEDITYYYWMLNNKNVIITKALKVKDK